MSPSGTLCFRYCIKQNKLFVGVEWNDDDADEKAAIPDFQYYKFVNVVEIWKLNAHFSLADMTPTFEQRHTAEVQAHCMALLKVAEPLKPVAASATAPSSS